jgi:tetratricopeptide (TPR) repeat protein
MTDPIPFADVRQLQAAEGWLELGNLVEAGLELEKVSPHLHDHPAVLEAHWQILAAQKKWDAALEVAAAVVQSVPDEAVGWIHRSFCLHELKRTEEARENLLRVVDKFAESTTMRYNLACYECQLGRPEQAKLWLRKACELGNPRQIKLAALDDPDLAPLREYIGGI